MQTFLTQLNDSVLLRDSEEVLNKVQLLSVCHCLAVSLGAKKISTLALHADNSVDWVVANIACQLAKVCIIPLPTYFSLAQLQYVFAKNPVDAILCENLEPFETIFNPPLSKEHNFFSGLSLISKLKIDSLEAISAYPKNTALVTFTSGSTGQPKGVCLSTEQLLRQAENLSVATGLKQQKHLCVLPLSTLLENVAGVYTALFAGGEVIIPSLLDIGFTGSSSLNAEKFMNLISKEQPNSLILTPQLLQVLIAGAEKQWQPPASLKFIAVGGAKVASSLIKKARDLGLPAFEGYGLSECASVVSLNIPRQDQPGTAGKVLPGLTMVVERGEIVVAGNAMLGYANEPESWYQEKIYTGDLGGIDQQGFLSIAGRKKNLLISSYGRNINPEWVESELLANSHIKECIVLGDARPYCVALISTKHHDSTKTEIQNCINKVNLQLPDYARIQRWLILPQSLAAQPQLLTGNGRPKRAAIIEQYAELIESLYRQAIYDESTEVLVS